MVGCATVKQCSRCGNFDPKRCKNSTCAEQCRSDARHNTSTSTRRTSGTLKQTDMPGLGKGLHTDPLPSWPQSPRPHVYRFPSSSTAPVCQDPQVTVVTCTGGSCFSNHLTRSNLQVQLCKTQSQHAHPQRFMIADAHHWCTQQV